MTIFDIIFLVLIGVFIYTRFFGKPMPKSKRGKKKQNVFKFPVDDIEKAMRQQLQQTLAQSAAKKTAAQQRAAASLTGIAQIKALDPTFDKNQFLAGAKSAYTMFYDACNNRDEESLDALTAPRLFDEVIDKLEAAGKDYQTKITSVDDVKIVDSKVHGRAILIDVKYTAKQSDKPKAAAKKVEQIWTWAKPVGTEDPNWELESISNIV